MLSIYQRQINLRTYNYYYQYEIDGIEGNGTINAYKNFQRDFGLVVDGIYGVNTENALINAVKSLQSKLNNKGYNLTVDGLVGNYTINAIKDFQAKNNLVVDGIAGVETFKKLGSYKCKYFDDSEFSCGCGCGLNLEKDKIKQIADEIREHFGRPAIITSGTRCKNYNTRVGGVSNSYHLTGNAIDIYINGVSYNEILSFTNKIVNEGRARYTYGGTAQMGNAVHIDTGGLE